MINITKPYKEDMIIPISVSVFGDKVDISVYEEFYSVACEYEAKYKGRYFSNEGLSFLADNIECDGYVRYDPATEYYIVYSADHKNDINDPRVVDIENAEYTIDETEFEADVIKQTGEPASLIVENGRIAAIAAANYFVEDDEEEVELAVETLPEFRGKGYGTAVLSHMINKVLCMNKIPTYRVSVYNDESIGLAEKCGFTEIGKEYYFNCYKEE